MERNREHLLELSRQMFTTEDHLYSAMKQLEICKNDKDEHSKAKLYFIEFFLKSAESFMKNASDEIDNLLTSMYKCPAMEEKKKE